MSNLTNEKEHTLDDVRREAANDIHRKENVRRVQLIVFRLGSEEYALTIDQIKEVVVTPRIARMPQTASFIRGVANIRGSIIAILDLERTFGLNQLQSEATEVGNYTLVVSSESHKVGILVKEVPNTLSVAESDIDQSSNFVQSNSLDQDAIRGVIKSGERLIILIDMVKLMDTLNIQATVNKAIK